MRTDATRISFLQRNSLGALNKLFKRKGWPKNSVRDNPAVLPAPAHQVIVNRRTCTRIADLYDSSSWFFE